MTALVLCLAAIPVLLLGVCLLGVPRLGLLLSFFLIEVIALICGIAGRRSVAGKVAAILSVSFLVLGMILFSRALLLQADRDFGGWPSGQRLGPSSEMGPDDPVPTQEFTEY